MPKIIGENRATRPNPKCLITLPNSLSVEYESLHQKAQAAYRHNLSLLLINDFLRSPGKVVPVIAEIFACHDQQVAKVLTALTRELLLQPMASSWSLMKNLAEKYSLVIRVPELRDYYQVLQNSKIVQDMIRFNSAANKVVAVARGVLSTSLGTTYYLDVQTTDACPNKCLKCWRFYEDENGLPRLITRLKKPGAGRPGFEQFKSVIKEAVDLGIEQLSSTGGGEPLMNPRLPELFEFAKQYAKSLGRDIKTFIPSSGLGVVFENPESLRRLVRSINNLRFSVDSFDRDFVRRHHGISNAQYDQLLQNLRNTAQLRREENPDMQIEVLILIYEGSHRTMDRTIEIARELGATRILINSTVDKPEFHQPDGDIDQAIRHVSEKAASGDYGSLVVEIDPALERSILKTAQPIDLANLEPALGKYGPCMKNILGLTPVITADGTFHVCFPCSQPPLSNKGDIFKIGNIMAEPFLRLMEKMKQEYRDIDVERDCSPDCRDILYFNAIIRKVVEDWLLGFSLSDQPFFDRTTALGTTRHPMHQEGFNVQPEAQERISRAASSVQNDKISDFNQIAHYLRSQPLAGIAPHLADNNPFVLLDRYETPNLLDVNLVKAGSDIFAFSFEIGRIVHLKTGQAYKFGDNLADLPAGIAGLFSELHALKAEGSIYLAATAAGTNNPPPALVSLKLATRKNIMLSKYTDWPAGLAADAYNYYQSIRSGAVKPGNLPAVKNGITLISLFNQAAPEKQAVILDKLHAYLFQLATTREFCRDFLNTYQILLDNGRLV